MEHRRLGPTPLDKFPSGAHVIIRGAYFGNAFLCLTGRSGLSLRRSEELTAKDTAFSFRLVLELEP